MLLKFALHYHFGVIQRHRVLYKSDLTLYLHKYFSFFQPGQASGTVKICPIKKVYRCNPSLCISSSCCLYSHGQSGVAHESLLL